MSIAAAQISAEALHDMIDIFSCQPWTKELHEELVELWSICTSREQQILLKDLVINFLRMFDANREAHACKQFNGANSQLNLTPRETWIAAAANKDERMGHYLSAFKS